MLNRFTGILNAALTWDRIFTPQLEQCFFYIPLHQNFKLILDSPHTLRPPVTPFHRLHAELQRRASNVAYNLVSLWLILHLSASFLLSAGAYCPVPAQPHYCELKLLTTCLDTSSTSAADAKARCPSRNASVTTVSYIPSTQAFPSETFHFIWRGHCSCLLGQTNQLGYVPRWVWKVTRSPRIQAVVFWSNCICCEDVGSGRWGVVTSEDD